MIKTSTYVLVVRAIPKASSAMFWGYEIMKATNLKSGTVYPILHRMESDGLLESVQLGRHRFYWLTEEGRKEVMKDGEE